MKDKKKYWFDDVVSLNLEGEVWLPIKDYSLYEVSNYGRIRRKIGNKIKILKQYKRHDINNDYLSIYILNDNLKKRYIGIHQLICLSFNGEPSKDEKYEVNHIDGDKLNNIPSNLEWMTRGQNLVHAYKLGLRKDATPVIVKDTVTGKIEKYYSMIEFGRRFSIPETKLATFFTKYHSKLYMDRYEIKKDYSNRKVTNYEWVKDIKAYDYFKKELIVTTDSAMMESITGVNRATINSALRRKYNGLINGFIFKYCFDDEKFPEFTDEVISNSKTIYNSKNERKERENEIIVKDYLNNSIKEYNSTIAASMDTGISSGTIKYLIRKSEPILFRGKVFKYKSNDKIWPDYGRDMVELSLRNKNMVSSSPVKITDTFTNTTKLYTSVAEFAREIGGCSKRVNDSFRKEEMYKGRWHAERVVI